MENKETAIKWLRFQILEGTVDTKENVIIIKLPRDVFKKAKEMEKEQIIKAYWSSYKEGQYSGDKTAEEYYQETYEQ
jgi:HEPN domain-containing protein